MPLPDKPHKPVPLSMTVKQRSQKQEKRVAKAIGGRTQIASGALAFAKADVKGKKLLVECKTTAKKSFALKLATLRKIEVEAMDEGRIPAMVVAFEGPKTEEFVILRMKDLPHDFIG